MRDAVHALPARTQCAMRVGLDANRGLIMVGAYVDRDGGVCPMLAAHRCGGRTDLLAFARAWDRYTHAKRPRRATDDEVATLSAFLAAAVLDSELPHSDLGAAIEDYQSSARRRRSREAAQLGLGWMTDEAPHDEPAQDARELEPA